MSVATVSRALRPDTQHLVKESTREKVRALASSLNYVPSAAAGQLRSRRQYLVSVVMPDIPAVFYSGYYSGILRELLLIGKDQNIDFRLVFPQGVHDDFEKAYHDATAFSNAIVYLSEPLNQNGLKVLLKDPRPHVILKNLLPIDVPLEDVSKPVIGTDDIAGSKMVTHHLIEKKAKAILLVNGPGGKMRDFYEREFGFREAMEGCGHELDDSAVIETVQDFEGGIAAWETIAKRSRLPDAVICGNDDIAMGLITASRDAGAYDPGRLAVCGYDDSYWASRFTPKLTSIHQPLDNFGKDIVELLMKQGSQSDTGPSHRIYQPHLEIRESTTSYLTR